MALNVNGADQTTSGTVSISDTDTIRLAVDYSGYESCELSASPSGVLSVTKTTEGQKSDIYTIEVLQTGTVTLTISYTDENNQVTTETITFDAVKGAEPSGVWTDVKVQPVLRSRAWINLDPSETISQAEEIEGYYGMPVSASQNQDYEIEFVPVVEAGATPEEISSVQITSADTTAVSVQNNLTTSRYTNNNVALLRCLENEDTNNNVTLTFVITTESGAQFTKVLVVNTRSLASYFTFSNCTKTGAIYVTELGTTAYISSSRLIMSYGQTSYGYTNPLIDFAEPQGGWNADENETVQVTATTDNLNGTQIAIAGDAALEQVQTRTIQLSPNSQYTPNDLCSFTVRFALPQS